MGVIVRMSGVVVLGWALAACGDKAGDGASSAAPSGAPLSGAASKAAADTKTADAKKADNVPMGPFAKKTGMPECDAYLVAMDKFLTCDDKKLDPDQKNTYRGATKMIADSWTPSLADDAKKTTVETCKKMLTDLQEGAKFRECPL